MSLEGLRAWIGEVERKLGARTRVFLVLVAIAIGGAGAGIYLALDASEGAVNEDEVQRLQEQIDSLDAEATGGTDPRVSQLELELDALKAQLEALRGKGASGSSGGTSEGSKTAGGSSADGGGSAAGLTSDPSSDETKKDAKSTFGRAEQSDTTAGKEEQLEGKRR